MWFSLSTSKFQPCSHLIWSREKSDQCHWLTIRLNVGQPLYNLRSVVLVLIVLSTIWRSPIWIHTVSRNQIKTLFIYIKKAQELDHDEHNWLCTWMKSPSQAVTWYIIILIYLLNSWHVQMDVKHNFGKCYSSFTTQSKFVYAPLPLKLLVFVLFHSVFSKYQ